MSWLHRAKQGVKIQRTADKRELPEGMWMKCPGCSEIIYRVELEKNQWVCNRCSYHFPLSARQYVEILTDPGSFTETYRSITSLDPLDFRDAKEKYRLKLKKTMLRTNLSEAVLTGQARLHDREVVLGVFDFAFLGGSMGSVVGEKIARAGLDALARRAPFIILSRSGGARMHESVLSLMQMAKTSAVLAKLHEAGVPFISIMCNPTTGGVSASFAALGDVILAEPKAQIGFAGPRVIRETINQELPPGFQTAEFVQECGFVDLIVHRRDLRSVLDRVLGFLCVLGQEVVASPTGSGSVPAEEAASAGARPVPEVAPPSRDVVEVPETTPRQVGRHGPA
ncbi:MAG TPA: acetyl-CoA carboxylase, carboxyltransferase subunit beta [Candidatus Krumholzibacteria bacterium]|nr:acetyl-CoA carboxylase, carboxyltransferase subunit beta [Candidatus Krumholzibacteria bacterium]